MQKKLAGKLSICLLLISLLSCQENISELGSSYINSIELQPAYEVEEITAYSEKFTAIQTNSLTNYLIGTYDDPIFGTTENSILSQIRLATPNEDFGMQPELDSVILNLPLYLTQIDTDEFELDSIFGTGDFKLKLYESNYFLRELDPGENGEFQNNQQYFSNQFDEIAPFIESTPFFESETINLEELKESITLIDRSDIDNPDTTSVNPRIRLKLPLDYFNEKIMSKAGEQELVNNNNFINYFRGIHMVLEPSTPEPLLINLNLNTEQSNITLHYKTMRPGISLDPDATPEPVESFDELSLNFTGINVNFYDNQFAVDLSNQNQTQGEENIYLKGGEGSSGVINLFTGIDSNGDGVSDQLEELRQNQWVINEANLIMYVNEDLASTNKNIVNRLFIYDIENNTILEDYRLDPTLSENPETSASIHLPPIDEDADGNKFYRLRLTNHINNIINKDSTNVKLGLSISQNVNITRTLDIIDDSETFESVLESSALSPRGTVLHGNNSPLEDKRLKLRIIYTETNN
ncbi:DUF4270 domain-containing protein [Psychroflexus sp. ALD_RP9]|uniref:DUF4270 domain-containing protein n=1 Tax=Psychroflexus sp. ALD_RP9 TaxID=2777186 RepID=UPI001A9027E5|nr:DUF4270 domain-containing protein [Psychroflexus sp. ALD_RP9]QSS97885.1 DUF4270 domain-containing protein [Psychroflexus sp. ALD_RP9]